VSDSRSARRFDSRAHRYVVLDDPWQQVPFPQVLPLVAVETVGLTALFALYVLLDELASPLASLLIPPVVTLVILVALPRQTSSRPMRILVSYAIASGVGLGLTAFGGHGIGITVLTGGLTLLAMHITGTLHPPSVAVALISTRSSLNDVDALLAAPFVMAAVLFALGWAYLGHQILGDREYPQQWW
jgi:CBS-domain-containing membrane protein